MISVKTMLKVCTNCDTGNPMGHRFCTECGTQLPTVKVEVHRCMQCKMDYLPACKFCPSCGTGLVSVRTTTPKYTA